MSNIRLVSYLAVLIASPAFAQGTGAGSGAPATPPADAQPATPPAPPAPPTPPPAPPTPPPAPPTPPPHHDVAPPLLPDKPAEKKPEQPAARAKYDLSFYGFVELDSIWDSTQGFNDLAGNTAIAHPGTYTGDHGQLTFGARNSRIGMKLAAPVIDDIKASAQLEMDFLGNQPPGISEAAFWQNPTFRFRHFNLKLETKPFDILIGQYWQLFGWQSLFHPNTVEIQGIPGQVYSRAPQIRVSKLIKGGAVDVELAVAAARPPQRASSTPDGHVGVKLMLPKYKAWHTAGSTGSGLDSAALGVSAVGRRFAVDEFSAAPSSQVTRNGYGLSIDALVPIVPATKDNHGGALTLTASFVTGAGIADLFTSLSGGVSNPALPNPSMTTPAPAYTPNVDGGDVLFFNDAPGMYSLHPIQWTAFLGGLQYYLPPSGKVFASINFSDMSSGNAHLYGAKNKVFDSARWTSANLMTDLTPAVRLGISFDWYHQTYVDGVDADNYRVQGSAFYIF